MNDMLKKWIFLINFIFILFASCAHAAEKIKTPNDETNEERQLLAKQIRSAYLMSLKEKDENRLTRYLTYHHYLAEKKLQRIKILNTLPVQEKIPPKKVALSVSDQLRGKLHWPVRGPIMRHFGSSLGLGRQSFSGTLIKIPMGTPVHAIYQGKIIFANELRGFGLLVIVNHGDGFMSLYARNKKLYAKVGDRVKTGDVIALAGNIKDFARSALYFEIRQNGFPVNPASWCMA